MDHLRSGVEDQSDQHAEILSLLKIQKISQARWHIPVDPATWEAEAEESFEPGRRRLQRAEIAPLHSSLGNRERLCLKKTKQSKQKPNHNQQYQDKKFLSFDHLKAPHKIKCITIHFVNVLNLEIGE